jgi:hypothetical protein
MFKKARWNMQESIVRNAKQRFPGVIIMHNLRFFEPSVADCLEQLRKIEFVKDSRVTFCQWDEFAAALVNDAKKMHSFAVLSGRDGMDMPSDVERVLSLSEGDVLLANKFDAESLSSYLIEYLDAECVTILAPITAHYFRNRPLFLISIPKGGTHLLYRLAEAAGYSPAVVHNGDLAPGNWYCVEYSNSHTVARDFFIDTVRRKPFGNRHHPFPRTPTLFIYRNPLDIVISEANYYHRDGATVFSSYLRHLDFEQRLMRLIDDPHLMGSIRDRIDNFVPWFDCENVIPVSFEELIGTKGGGDDAVRNQLIWSLQLKLHIPGSPEALGASIFKESSPTFHEGRIGSSRKNMTPEAIRRFFALNQDFMQLTGYADCYVNGEDYEGVWEMINTIPSLAENFRRRPLRTSKEDFRDMPFIVEWEFLDYNIVRFDGRYYALSRYDGPVDLIDLRSRGKLSRLLSAQNIESLKAEIIVKNCPEMEKSPTHAKESEYYPEVVSQYKKSFLSNLWKLCSGYKR